ncbi:unnamed protein product [Vicia faba]|uniref:Replication protein A 70 kDa DNA-binding subunit B/D first OB fold domain-containing protein n=1 Tax=Vicia faba TaxID=3906 RepID=A0AAV1B3E0_VICFA|nr:unnamed protein product [Vicia faba]
MELRIEYVRDINDSKYLWKIVVRCKDLWSVISASNKEHLEMVLIDAKCAMIQVIVPPHLILKHKSALAFGNTYIMLNFKVSNDDFSFKSTSHSFKLVFYDILGGVTKINQTQMNAENSKSKFVFTITDMSHKDVDSVVVILHNARIKGAQGGFPLNVSNTWNDTRLTINGVSIFEIKQLEER